MRTQCSGRRWPRTVRRTSAARRRRGENAHTSEQKLTGIGQLLDRLLQPLWKDAGPLLKILKAKTGAAFGQALKNIPGFRKELVFEHTLEYLQIADATADSPMFSCKMSRDSMAKFAHGGKNSQVFLDIINSRSQRAEKPTPIHLGRRDERRQHSPTAAPAF